MPQLFGIIGFPLSHSWSPGYFSEKFQKEGLSDYEYRAFPLENISEFEALLGSTPGLRGLNVTIPYKEQVIPYLDQLQGAAAETQAVNTIKITPTETGLRKTGYNTDVVGFARSLEEAGIPIPERCLILGTGGAAKAVAWVLRKQGSQVCYASRKPQQWNEVGYETLQEDDIRQYGLIINSTPLGMYPNIEASPDIGYARLQSHQVLYDLTYNPARTTFLQKGYLQGCKIINGLPMLIHQAEAAWEIWNNPNCL